MDGAAGGSRCKKLREVAEALASPAPSMEDIGELQAELKASGLSDTEIDNVIREHFAPPEIAVLEGNAATVQWFAEVLGMMRWEALADGRRQCLGADWPQIDAHRRMMRRRPSQEQTTGLSIMATAYANAVNRRQ